MSNITDTDFNEQLLSFFELCHTFKGKQLRTKEYISSNKNDFEYSYTKLSTLEFKLLNFSVIISWMQIYLEI